jgi:hypothetical protein
MKNVAKIAIVALSLLMSSCGDLHDDDYGVADDSDVTGYYYPPDYPMSPRVPRCRIGKPCGDSCISRDKTCRVGSGSSSYSGESSYSGSSRPNCTTGKRCGDSCISRDKTCRL